MIKTYETFQDFWAQQSQISVHDHGFYEYQLVKCVHVSDMDYARQLNEAKDQLGFQPLWLTFANPLDKTTQQILAKGVTDSMAADFITYARHAYHIQLPARFNNFTPDQTHAFAEYDDWESFYYSWLERDGRSMLNVHIPLLFDHTPRLEYWLRQQSGLKVLPYQRLLLTSYFAPKDQFFDFFIKNVDDAEIDRIKLLCQSRVGLNLDRLYAQPKAD